jgi:lipid-A-disaccharide synthase
LNSLNLRENKPALLVVAGEASADAHGAKIVAHLKKNFHNLDCFGIGGTHLVEAGLSPVADGSALSVVGISEAIRGLKKIRHVFSSIVDEVERRRPAVALLIDLPDFNLRLAKKLKKRGIAVVYYIAPQAWAWRKGRVRQIRRRVDKLCAVFPFEEEFFKKHRVEVEFVGHPLLEEKFEDSKADQYCSQRTDGPYERKASGRVHPHPPRSDRHEYPSPASGRGVIRHKSNVRGEGGEVSSQMKVALVPGSRRRELERLLPPMIEAARILKQSYPELSFVLPVAAGLDSNWVAGFLKSAEVDVQLVSGSAPAALSSARLALIGSGTATLEAALAGVPMVVVYKVSKTTYALVRPIFQLEHICIVNILAQRRIVPELIQGRVTAQNIVDQALPLMSDSLPRKKMIAELAQVKKGLGAKSPSERVANIISQLLLKE